jgi:phospholipase/carboxylesterase
MTTLDGPRLPARARHAPADSLVVLLHGYGADGNDLIGLADALAPALPRTAFASPHAPHPCGMAPMGREWFPLARRDPAEYVRGVEAAAPLLDRFLDAECGRVGVPPERLALVGFSQGTMMALHVGLRRRRPLAALVGFSGRLVAPERLPREMTSPCPVLLVHGTDDELLPADLTPLAAMAIAAAGGAAEWHLRPGLGHGIDPDGLAMAAGFLARCLAQQRRPPR